MRSQCQKPVSGHSYCMYIESQKAKNQDVPWGNSISYVYYTLRVGCQCDSSLTRSLVLVRQVVLPTKPLVWWRLIGFCVDMYPDIKVVLGCPDQDAARVA
jgi:hypothetical protein